ncbi:TOMM precursor leader peptide-binding protein [Desulfogranum japonicum]|uniref:TOMM precursor leader peptide-binding protein n=1 Tax=Desulfogranum japonicum TaxID=231447 RepID=UPI001377BA02|nr:TOMM precursor leader peptide-binding protein [Desulfogranum japonicum]
MRIALHNLSQTTFADRLQEKAGEYGLTPVNTINGSVTVLCICDSYLAGELDAWNRYALERNISWIPVWANWTRPWLGPFCQPGGPCHACMAKRIRDNLQVDNFIHAYIPEHQPFTRPRAVHALLYRLAPAFVLSQLALFFQESSGLLLNHLLEYDCVQGECVSHSIVRRPQCQTCGPEEPAQQTRILLQDNVYLYDYGGERRSCTPQETWRQYRHLISPVAGVASSFVRKSAPEQEHLHSYATGHAFPVRKGDLATLKGNLRHRSGGKGTTDIQARVGALCEAVERYSGLYTGEEKFVQGACKDLDDAVHINEISLFSDQQYNNREQWNATCPVSFQLVPHRLEHDQMIDWCSVWSLTSGSTRLVPAAYCYYGHRDLASFFCSCDSNGSAAGNTLEEAILRGFMELVERDAVALWWYNRTQQPMVDIDSFNDPYLAIFSKQFAQSGRSLWAINLTTDLGIPAIAAVSHRLDHSTDDIVIGFSADLDPKTALLRAVNEVGQFIPALSMQDKVGNTIYYYEDKCAIDWWKNEKLKEHTYLLPDESTAFTANDFELIKSQNQKTEVEFCVRRAASCGLETLVLNQTRPDIRLPVVKVIVPGMRHFWNRFAPGRLYEIPVLLGRQERVLAEYELNPIPMFF